jgi:hypothetical protein
MSDPGADDVEDCWYWDRRTNTAYRPVRTGADTVELVTVWHREEFADARESGALVPVEEIGQEGPDRPGTTFDLVESFRLDSAVAEGDDDA